MSQRVSSSPSSQAGGSSSVFRQWSIGSRFVILAALIVIFLASVTLVFYGGMREVVTASVGDSQKIALDGHKAKISVAANSAASLIGEALKGVPDPQRRIELIRAMVEEFRFEDDKSGYYFVYQNTTNIALPIRKDFQGQDKSDVQSVDGVYYVRELNARAHEGGGFVKYIFPKPGKGDLPKLGYSTMIPGTDMWIGTGVYIDNIEEEKKAILAASDQRIRSVLNRSFAITGICLVVFAVFCGFLIRSVVRPIQEATEIAVRCSEGNLDVVVDDSGRDEAARMQAALGQMVQTLRTQAGAVDKLAEGDLSVRFEVRSEHDMLSKSLNRVVETLQTLITDMRHVTRSASQGHLDVRAEAGRHRGGYREIVEGFNATLDAVVTPLHMAADCVNRIGQGEIPPRITDRYEGDFDSLKCSLNACIDGLGGLVEANQVLQAMAVNDYTHPVQGQYVGIFDEVKTAVNQV